jgi:hypothetical protein
VEIKPPTPHQPNQEAGCNQKLRYGDVSVTHDVSMGNLQFSIVNLQSWDRSPFTEKKELKGQS